MTSDARGLGFSLPYLDSQCEPGSTMCDYRYRDLKTPFSLSEWRDVVADLARLVAVMGRVKGTKKSLLLVAAIGLL